MKLIDRICIQAYLKKYLEYHHPADPFVLTEKNRFGSLLISNLRFKTKSETEKLQRLNIHKRYMTANLEIEIPEFYWYSYGSVITSRGQQRFNNFLLDEFQDRLVEFVAPGLKRKGDLNLMLLTFREKFGICEDELPLKTLQKTWEREKYRLTRCKSA
jgi:hypothetical protein